LDEDWHKQPTGPMKHMRLTHNPIDGKIYILGGDHAGTPGFAQSGRNEMYTYEIATNTWEMIQPYCPAGLAPAGPDEVGWAYDTKRKGFWMTKGFQWGTSGDTCPQPNGLFTGKGVAFYDPILRTWEHENRAGLESLGWITGNYKFAQYDPLTDNLIVLGQGSVATYDIASDVWSKKNYSISPTVRIQNHSSAIDLEKRIIYGIDKHNPRLFKYDIDAKTLVVLGQAPTIEEIEGHIVWNSVSKVLMLWDLKALKLHIYHPDTNTWEENILTQKPANNGLPGGPQLYGNGVVYDPYQNVLMIIGGVNTDTPYLFLYRYGPGTSGTPLDTVPPAPPQNVAVQEVN